MNLWLVSLIPASLRGRAVGGLTTFVFIGQFFSPIAAQPITDRFGLPGAFVVGGGAMLILALLLYVAGGRLKSN